MDNTIETKRRTSIVDFFWEKYEFYKNIENNIAATNTNLKKNVGWLENQRSRNWFRRHWTEAQQQHSRYLLKAVGHLRKFFNGK